MNTNIRQEAYNEAILDVLAHMKERIDLFRSLSSKGSKQDKERHGAKLYAFEFSKGQIERLLK